MDRKRNLKRLFVMRLLLVYLLCTIASAETIYVDNNRPGGDGSSWADAYKYLYDALDAATYGDEIHVAQGTYYPDTSGLGNPRDATFILKNGVALYGGYAGYGEADPNLREFSCSCCQTVLSGDLLGNDVPVGEPCDLENDPCRVDNSFHVVTASSVDANTILDGFTIVAGDANGFGGDPNYQRGGGMLNNNANLTIRNCIFKDNSAKTEVNLDGNGSGICNTNSSSPLLIDCMFSRNAAFGEGNLGDGAGVCNLGGCDPTLINCRFSENWTNDDGGGMWNANNDPTIIRCTFSDNSAGDDGGGVYNANSTAIFTNCIFVRNRSRNTHDTKEGGGMRNTSDCSVKLTNCLFFENSAENGGALTNRANSDAVLKNCILWGNTATNGGEVYLSNDEGKTSSITISYSNVEGGTTDIFKAEGCTLNYDTTNIDADPNFIDPNNDDFHLMSQAGRYYSEIQMWVEDAITSPCIDAGDPDGSVGYELFPNGGRINMGAYGGTTEASKSYFGSQNCVENIAGDINGDCVINFIDLAFLANHWLVDNR